MKATLRSLLRSPIYTLACLLTLTLGIAALGFALPTAIHAWRSPFAFPHAERWVAVSPGSSSGWQHDPISGPDYQDLSLGLRDLADWGIARDRALLLKTQDGQTQNLRGCQISAGLFQTLGLKLVLGREFRPDECGTASDRVVLLDQNAWRNRWGGDPDILGRSLDFTDGPRRVIGVVASSPETASGASMPLDMMNGEAFIPWAPDGGEATDRGSAAGRALARLKPGCDLARLRGALARLEPSLGPSRTQASNTWHLRAFRLLDRHRAQQMPLCLAWLGLGLLMAMLTCGNLAHLMLARWLAKHHELAMRAALGGWGWRLFRPLLLEIGVLCAGGAVLAALGAVWMLRMVGESGFPLLSLFLGMGLSMVFCLGALTGLMGFSFRRLDLDSALKEGGSQATASRRAFRLRRWLVAAQVGLSSMALGGAIVCLRDVQRLTHLDTGFQVGHVVIAQLDLTTVQPPMPDFMAGAAHLQDELQRQVATLPGVQTVAFSDSTPFYDQSNHCDFLAHASDRQAAGGAYWVSPEYFGWVGPMIKQGRSFGAYEQNACVVSESLASRLWPGENPLGHSLSMGSFKSPILRVVGVVGEARHAWIDQAPKPAFYAPIKSCGAGMLTLFVRSDQPPSALIPALQTLLRHSRPGLGVLTVEPLGQLNGLAIHRHRVQFRYLMICALVALGLSWVGQSGLLCMALIQARREQAIRAALGATPSRIAFEILMGCLRSILPGLLVGSLGIAALTLLARSLIEGLSASDPWIHGPVMAMQMLGSVLLAVIPALRSAFADPMRALRME